VVLADPVVDIADGGVSPATSASSRLRAGSMMAQPAAATTMSTCTCDQVSLSRGATRARVTSAATVAFEKGVSVWVSHLGSVMCTRAHCAGLGVRDRRELGGRTSIAEPAYA
jgi:hypothetical protein